MSLQKTKLFAVCAAEAAWTQTTAAPPRIAATSIARFSIGWLLSTWVHDSFTRMSACRRSAARLRWSARAIHGGAPSPGAPRRGSRVLGDLRRLVVPVEVEEDEPQLALSALVRRREPPLPSAATRMRWNSKSCSSASTMSPFASARREGLGRRAEAFDAVGVQLVRPASSRTSRRRNRSATSAALRSVTTTPRWG